MFFILLFTPPLFNLKKRVLSMVFKIKKGWHESTPLLPVRCINFKKIDQLNYHLKIVQENDGVRICGMSVLHAENYYQIEGENGLPVEDYEDFNKLWGYALYSNRLQMLGDVASYVVGGIPRNIAMVAWRPNFYAPEFELIPYYRVNGEIVYGWGERMEKIVTVGFGDPFLFDFGFKYDGRVYVNITNVVDGFQYIDFQDFAHVETKWIAELKPYFGGQLRSPNNMSFDIKTRDYVANLSY